MKNIFHIFCCLLGLTLNAQFNNKIIPTYTHCLERYQDAIWHFTDAGIYVYHDNDLEVLDHFWIKRKDEPYVEVKVDRANNLWVAMDIDGIAKYDGKNWTIWDFVNTPVFVPDFGIRSIGVEADGTVWAIGHTQSSGDTMKVYRFKNDQWSEVHSGFLTVKGEIPTFALSPHDKLIAVYNDTLLYFENDQWIGIPEFDNKKYVYYNCPVFDSKGNLWVSRYNGVVKYHSLTERPTFISMPQDRNYSLAFDDQDQLWATTDEFKTMILKNQQWKQLQSLAGTSQASYAWLLLKGKANKMFLAQSIYYYECVITEFENETPITNHYLEETNCERIGKDGNGNLWFGGWTNLMVRKNISDGSFDYFELFQFSRSEFDWIHKKFVSGNGNQMFYISNNDKLFMFDGVLWKEQRRNGNSLKVIDACVSDEQRLFVVTESTQTFETNISVCDLNTQTWQEIDLSFFGELSIGGIKKGKNNTIWFHCNDFNAFNSPALGRINKDLSVDLFLIPGGTGWGRQFSNFNISESTGLIQLISDWRISGNPGTSIYYFDPVFEEWSEVEMPVELLTDVRRDGTVDIFTVIDNQNHTWISYTRDFNFLNRQSLVLWIYDGNNWIKHYDGSPEGLFRVNDMVIGKDNNIYILGDHCLLSFPPVYTISGKTIADNSSNCISDTFDQIYPLVGLQFTDTLGNIINAYSRKNGNFSVVHPVGNVNVKAKVPNPFWETCEPDGYNISLIKDVPVNLDILLFPVVECPFIESRLTATAFRRCMESTLSISVVNNGTIATDSAYVIISIPVELKLEKADIPYKDLGSQKYRFDLGTMQKLETRNFRVFVKVDCNAIIGQSLCFEINSYPDEYCNADPLWSGADIRLSANCINNQVKFQLLNEGKAATTSLLIYTVYKNDVKAVETEYSLDAGASIDVSLPTDGSTYRLISNQESHHPAEKKGLSLAVEGCNAAPTEIRTGFVDSRRNSTGALFQEIPCFRVIGAYDPNDKLVFPAGVGELTHFVERDEELEYTIRFQNTGNDTAFQVVIRDTLDAYLDFSTFKLLQSSHDVSIDNVNNVFAFHYYNILLPDSTIDHSASNGFIKFSIKPKANIPYGYYIANKAFIYFDVNKPVETNTIWNIIKPKSTENVTPPGVDKNIPPNQLYVYPNPATANFIIDVREFKNFEIVISDVQGRVLSNKKYKGGAEFISQNLQNFRNGMYFINLINHNGKQYFAKLIKQ